MEVKEKTPSEGSGGALPLLVYTDGACQGNPGPGGWAAVIVKQGADGGSEVARLSGQDPSTTNNRMELQAAIAVLSWPGLTQDRPITVRTDSEYVRKGITEWLTNWKAKGWRTGDRKPVKNLDLWQELDRLIVGRAIRWERVPAHSGEKWNELADSLARGVEGFAGNV